MKTQQELKIQVAEFAVDYIKAELSSEVILGVGSGSTVNCFIKALAPYKDQFKGAVASSKMTSEHLKANGIQEFQLNQVEHLAVYIDGADEVDTQLAMIKGGGAALTQEKIVASVANSFICIADESKKVKVLGEFPLPIEVIPMARSAVARHLSKLGGQPVYREGVITDNGNDILDVHGLSIREPKALEDRLNRIPGVVTNGIFAYNHADVLLVSGHEGVVVERVNTTGKN